MDSEDVEIAQGAISVYIAGSWSAEDLAQLMRSANDIYNLAAVLDSKALRNQDLRHEFFPMDRRRVRRFAATQIAAPWLAVGRIRYASPGVADFAGIGTLVGHVKDFLLGILDRFIDRKMRSVALNEKVALAERARIETDYQREEKKSLVQHTVALREFELREKAINLRQQDEETRALTLKNFEQETEFAAKMMRLCRDNDLTPDQATRVIQWIGSRERPVIELVQLQQIVDVQDRRT